MIRAKAPGKLYIAGEYAVVEPGQPAVLVAVDRYLTVHLEVGEAASVGRVHSSAYERGPLGSCATTILPPSCSLAQTRGPRS